MIDKSGNLDYISTEDLFMIECEDIVLREFRLEDLDKLYALTLQHEITDYMPEWIGTREKYEDAMSNVFIKKNKEFFKSMPNVENHSITLGIILKETNELIGWCFACHNNDLPNCNTEIAYAISKYYRNKGYTTQAAKALINYLFEETNMDTLSALALINNLSSNRIIQKCGFKFSNNIEIGNRKFNWYKLCKKNYKYMGEVKL